MHALSLTAPLDTGKAFGVLEAGDWLMQDQNAFECAMLAYRDTARLDNKGCVMFGDIKLDDPSKPCILLMRSGAIGDLLFLTPVIAAYRKSKPGYPIHLCCRKEDFPIFDNTSIFDALIPYPLPESKVNEYWFVHSLEDVIEMTNDVHATDAFASVLGVTIDDYRPVFNLTGEERASAGVMMSGKRPKIGVQPCASTRNRNYPMHQWAKVITGLEDKGWEVFLFGTPSQFPPLPPELQRTFIHNLSNSGMTFRETASVLSHCDAFVGVDSALIHLCHALDIPAVGLYGPFSWQTRTSKAPLTYALMGTGECANCRWHAKLGQHFPDKECRKTQQCSVLASITPERILAKVDTLKP